MSTTTTAEDTNSPNHPLFLHQNDNPGLILISKKLVGSENYSSWKRSMSVALNAKNKLKIVTKEYREPELDSTTRSLWERNNDMIISWILNTVSEEISNSLNFINSAAGLWDEVDALEAPYMCNCLCTCENGRVNGEREQRKRLIQFLTGLDDSYSNIRGQILLLQPLPTTAKAYGMIKQEEKQREGILPKPITPAIMSVSGNVKQYNHQKFTKSSSNNTAEKKSTFKAGVHCTTCYREGHTKEECYKNIGYPPGHPLHGKYQPKQFTKGKTINSVFMDNHAEKAQTTTQANQEGSANNDLMTARMD
ncbi:uncharacterized protein [Rutidosis leptorrhynchoides]|uniref:uncharacterized protein n=1 Tax=Rutidosis leptorrhynchoides TaxID=125765 RepID=UPI003A9A4777